MYFIVDVNEKYFNYYKSHNNTIIAVSQEIK